MKREVKLLRGKAIDSLLLAIEHFNRPTDAGRATTVLILLDHAFEMALKACILHRGGRIREKRAIYTIGFDSCVRKAVDDPKVKFLKPEQAFTLQAINALRDAAQHYLVEVPEQQLYLRTQAGVTLFADTMLKVLDEKMLAHLPERVLPVSTNPPKDLGVLLADEVSTLRKLLAPNLRRRIDARSRVRALAIMDSSIRGSRVEPSDSDLDKLLDKIQKNADAADIFPGVASLSLSTSEGAGMAFSIRLEKKQGVPVQLVPEGTPNATVVAVHKADATQWYALGRDQVADQVGYTRPMTTAIIRYMKLQEDAECFRNFVFGKSRIGRYSPKTVERIRAAAPGLNLDTIWQQFGPRRRGAR